MSDHHLRLSFGTTPCPSTLQGVHAAAHRLKHAAPPGLLDVTPAYTTLLLAFDLATLDPAITLACVLNTLTPSGEAATGDTVPPPRLIEIPVCYATEFGPDLNDVAAHCGLAAEAVAHAHAQADYTVAFIGFSPGFGYLSGLPAQLATPRLAQPRVRVAPGSVGIAGDQTAIYPHATPGGWRLIGRTPLTMFEATRAAPSLLAIGDRVRFVPISADRFHEIAGTPKGGA